MLNKTPWLVKLLLTAVLAFCGMEAFAQTITGKVTDQDNKPLPGVSVQLTDEDAEKVRKTIDMFDDMDDVQEVYTNADLPDDDDEE